MMSAHDTGAARTPARPGVCPDERSTMSRSRTPRTVVLATLSLVAVAFAALSLAACSDSSDDGSGETTTTLAEGQTIRFDEQIQKELAEVGCHPGTVDGVMGPKTDEAIRAFQTADGLTVDGELGPDTDSALKTAVDDGTTVCSDTTTTTVAGGSTTTAATSGQAPCTATALLGGLPAEGETIKSFVCAGGYAAGTESGGGRFILQSQDGKWYAVSQDPCGSASAGIPPVILSDGCES